MRIRWLAAATRDRDAQMDYIARDRPRTALIIDDEVDRQVDMLLDHPRMGRVGQQAGTRELVISGTKDIAIYRLIGDEIRITRFIHGAQQWPPRRPTSRR